MTVRQQESDRTPLELLELRHLGWRAKYAPDMNDTYVAGEGEDVRPPVMVIGEAPGAEEVLRVRPFVGPSGRVLRQLMEVAGLFTGYAPHFGNANCWLTNVVKFRPPNNRTPFPQEIKTVRPLLRQEWKAIGKPRVIVLVGGVALHAYVGERRSIMKVAGKLHIRRSRVDGEKLFIWPMIHPSYGLKNPPLQPVMEEHWTTLGRYMEPYKEYK